MGIYFGGKSNLVSPTENNVQTNEFLGKKSEFVVKHIKLFPQCDEHLFFSVLGVRNH